jgi:hypothetical protein
MNLKPKTTLFFLLFSLVSANLYATPWTWASFPQMAAGGGYTTYLTISDPLQQDVSKREVDVMFYNQNGSALTVTVNHGVGQTTGFAFDLADGSEITFAITSSTLITGRIEVAAEGIARFNSSLRYAVMDSVGNITDVVGVLPVNPNYSWTITVDKQQAWQNVGVAVANWWSDVKANVQFDLYQNGNRVAGTGTVTRDIDPMGQLALYVGDIFPSFTGIATLRISCSNATISVIAMRQDGSQFSSLSADAGAQLWSWTFTNPDGVQNGTWSWRFIEEVSFYGDEQNPWNPDFGVTIRGILDKSSSPFFFLEWWYYNDASNQGTILFQGIPGTESGKEVINGSRVAVRRDGTVTTSYTFKATRIY